MTNDTFDEFDNYRKEQKAEMTLEEKLHIKLDWMNVKHIAVDVIIQDIVVICQQEIDEAKSGQRDIAGSMANEMQRIAMRYNTVVSTEALNMEFKEIFDKYFPSPKEEV